MKTAGGREDAFTKLAQMGFTVLEVHHRQPTKAELEHVEFVLAAEQSVRVELPHAKTDGGSFLAFSVDTHVEGTAAQRHQEHVAFLRHALSSCAKFSVQKSVCATESEASAASAHAARKATRDSIL